MQRVVRFAKIDTRDFAKETLTPKTKNVPANDSKTWKLGETAALIGSETQLKQKWNSLYQIES